MISVRDCESISKVDASAEEGVKCTSVAIQWQIWLHLGSERLGASGSVRAIVSWMVEVRGAIASLSLLVDEEVGWKEGTASMKWMEGWCLAFFGLIVFPTSAEAFFQLALRVRRGVKGSRMVGIMLAFSSLEGRKKRRKG